MINEYKATGNQGCYKALCCTILYSMTLYLLRVLCNHCTAIVTYIQYIRDRMTHYSYKWIVPHCVTLYHCCIQLHVNLYLVPSRSRCPPPTRRRLRHMEIEVPMPFGRLSNSQRSSAVSLPKASEQIHTITVCLQHRVLLTRFDLLHLFFHLIATLGPYRNGDTGHKALCR